MTAGPLEPGQQAFVERVRQDWGDGAVGISPVDPQGRLIGPFDLMAASPDVGTAVLAAASSFRRAHLSVAARELVILQVAVDEGAEFMWAGHLPVALDAGLAPEAADAVRAGGVPALDEPLGTIHRVAAALIDTGDLEDAEFSVAVDTLGWPVVQEIVWLVGVYQAFGLAMRVARTPAPRTKEKDR